MIDDNYLDTSSDFEIVRSRVESEQTITAIQYEVDAIADHITGYYE